MKSLLLTLLLFPILLFSQKTQAPQQIKDLKNSVLLVRLKTSGPKIRALKESGHTAMALQEEQKQLLENKDIAKAFHENFHFCPVYFFFSDASKDIINRHFQGKLMDENLSPVSGISKPVPVFFVAEFGNIERTEDKNFTGYTLEPDTAGRNQMTANYSGSPDFGFSALILRDSSFIQLKDPFPYYVRTYESISLFKRKKSKAVKLLNQKLESYYRQASHQ